MKTIKYSIFSFCVLVGFLIFSCSNTHRINLMSPSDKTIGQNVITARLTWSSDCDSFDVFLGSGTDYNTIPKVATVIRNVFNTERLDFNRTYFGKSQDIKMGRILFFRPSGVSQHVIIQMFQVSQLNMGKYVMGLAIFRILMEPM